MLEIEKQIKYVSFSQGKRETLIIEIIVINALCVYWGLNIHIEGVLNPGFGTMGIERAGLWVVV